MRRGEVRRVMPRFAWNDTPRARFLTDAQVRMNLDALIPGRRPESSLSVGASFDDIRARRARSSASRRTQEAAGFSGAQRPG
jgi:hypothetical protein